MDLNIIEICFHIGKNFAVTPSTLDNYEASFWQSTYNLMVFLFFTAGSSISLYYRAPAYIQYNPIQLVLWVFTDVVRYVHNVYTLVVVIIIQRAKLFNLIFNLRESFYGMDQESESLQKSYYLTFILAQASFCVVISFMFYICYVSYNLYESILLYLTEFLQFYTQFFFITFCCVVVKMLRARYQKTLSSRVFSSCAANLNELRILKKKIFTLKQTVDIFNDIFGGTVLLNILFTSSKSIVYLDRILKTQDASAQFSSTFNIFLHVIQVAVLVLMWVSRFVEFM
jgi:hypothetical protein